MIAPAYTSHFSCSRSTVAARRYRNTRETRAARPVPTISSTPPMARITKTSPAGAATPTGFGVGVSSLMIRGAKLLPRTHPAMPAAAAQATGRQRREGRCPVGNSSSTKTASPMPNSQIQPIQLTKVSAPGKCASSTSLMPAAYDRPVTDSSHPMGLPGRFHTSKAPTVAKPVTNAIPATPSAPLPCWLTRLAGSGRTAV